jgi:hypothetical protein
MCFLTGLFNRLNIAYHRFGTCQEEFARNFLPYRGLQAEIEAFTQKDRTYYRVLVGPSYCSKEDATQANTSFALEYSWIRSPALAGTIMQRQTAASGSAILTQSAIQEVPIPVELEERFEFANTPQKTLSNTEGVWYLETLPGQ